MWFSSLWASGKSQHPRSRRSPPTRTRSYQPRLDALEDRLVPSTLNVTANADTGASGTLRWAVGQANASRTPDTIDILTTQTIVLTQGALRLSQSMTIEATTGTATISGDGKSGVFSSVGEGALTLSNLTITDGKAFEGGGIYNYYGGSMTLTNCTVSGNSATLGGGIYVVGNGSSMTLRGCTVSGNFATDGGGIYALGFAITLTQCTVSGNSASDGGGIYVTGSGMNQRLTQLNDCTVSHNSASDGGGMYMADSNGGAQLTDCIVSDNTATITGGGIDNAALYVGGALDLIGGDNVFSGNSPNNITGSYTGLIRT
jgi:predicted outer membrane repeat protein